MDMLYILEGVDRDQKQKELQKIIKKHSPDTVLRFEAWNEGVVEYIDSVDLFGETKLVVLYDAVLDDIVSFAEDLKNSKNTFVCMYNKSLTVQQKKLVAGIELVSCLSSKKSDPEFNTFALTDALVARDKKNLWVLYQKARKQGVSEQEIVPILVWQLKTMVLVAKTSVSESGLKPFVYNKTKKSLEKYSLSEIENLYTQFVSMYHGARRGSVLHTDLERAILSL